MIFTNVVCPTSENRQIANNIFPSKVFKGRHLTFLSWNNFLLIRVVCPFCWSCWVVVILFPFRDFDFTAMSAKHCWGLWIFRRIWNGSMIYITDSFVYFYVLPYTFTGTNIFVVGFFFRWLLILTNLVLQKLTIILHDL